MKNSHARTTARRGLVLSLAAVLGACTVLGIDGGTTERARLQRERERWARQEISSYRFTYDVSCFCIGANGVVEIEVREEIVTGASYLATDDPLPLGLLDRLPTVDSLFAIIDHAIATRADLLEVSYHPAMGYPTRIAIDHVFGALDDEIVHVVAALVPIPPG